MKKKIIISIVFVCVIIVIIFTWINWSISNLSWARENVDNLKINTMSKSDIDLQLGRPEDPEGYFSGWDHAYFLQPDDSYIDSWWLLIDVDEKGKIVRADIVTD